PFSPAYVSATVSGTWASWRFAQVCAAARAEESAAFTIARRRNRRPPTSTVSTMTPIIATRHSTTMTTVAPCSPSGSIRERKYVRIMALTRPFAAERPGKVRVQGDGWQQRDLDLEDALDARGERRRWKLNDDLLIHRLSVESAVFLSSRNRLACRGWYA